MKEKYSDYINIFIGDDAMSADIFLVDAPSPDFYNVEKVLEYINEHGVVCGIDKSVIEEAVDNGHYGEFINFASGVSPRDPVNGFFDFKFNTKPSKQPKLKTDGSVDYYNLNLVEVTEKDQVIAEYISKQDGEDGYTIKGEILPGKKGRDMPPLRGKGFYVSEDGRYYYAEHDGKIELSMGRLIVSNMYTVSGNVDLSTGNIDFKGDLVITGNITRDMKVKATGNITVSGLVEAAYVEAGKGILVKGGILGGGKSVIKAGDNVYAQFIENASIEANNCVQADSIINSNINAYNDINVFGRTSCIIGGKLKANRYIKTKVIGSDKGVTTVLEVGVSNDYHSERKRCREKLEKLEDNLKKIEQLIERISGTDKEKTEVFIQATRSKIETSAEVFRQRAIVRELDSRIGIGRYAKIIAENRVYPGVRMFIDGIRYDVSEEFESIVFFRKEDKVVSKKFNEEQDKEENC